jgi:uncharacterized protein (TIGR03435 family)
MQASAPIIFLAAALSTAFGQNPPSFDIADVHASVRSATPRAPASFRASRYEIRQASMVELIGTAYNVEFDNVVGGPSWLEADRFDVIAKAAPSTLPETARLMLQTLLADRFKLAVHKETRPMPAFVLTVAKGKPKMKEADGSGDTGCRPQPPSDSRPYAWFICRNMTMEALVARLRMSGGAYFPNPVIDSTGLKGTWNFEVGWAPKAQLTRLGADGISVFDAVEQQLGLKLEPQNVPTSVIVVDRVNEKPTDNPPGVTARLPPPPPAEFEVASLKLSDPGEQPGGGTQSGGRVDMRAWPLRALIGLAWDVPPGQDFVGAPKWVDSAFVDVVAKVSVNIAQANGAPMPMSELQPMLRTLLIDRFKMKTHYEDRPVDAYTLVAVKPKLQKADPASRTRCKTDLAPVPRDSAAAGPPLIQAVCQNVTMAQFADQLPSLAPSYLHYPVPDESAIEGAWDFTFTFSRSAPSGGGGRNQGRKGGGDPAPAADGAPDPSGGMSLFDALTRQLGLKLEMQRRMAPVLVIDHIDEKPAGN